MVGDVGVAMVNGAGFKDAVDFAAKRDIERDKEKELKAAHEAEVRANAQKKAEEEKALEEQKKAEEKARQEKQMADAKALKDKIKAQEKALQEQKEYEDEYKRMEEEAVA